MNRPSLSASRDFATADDRLRLTSAATAEYHVPDTLIELDQWVLWRYVYQNGRWTKVPYSARGGRASVSEPADWAPFAKTFETWRAKPRAYAGPGFVFTAGGGIVGVDLDDCLNADQSVKSWARGIVEHFGDTFIDLSPSNTGLKLFVRGSLPASVPGLAVGDGQIELYDRGRFFTVTGRPFRGAPLEIENHTEGIHLLYERLTGGGHKARPLQPLPGERIPHGRQHNTLVSIAGTLRADSSISISK
jgi:primase-polymerase (primpol)-like protein